ncbi:MAG: tRNA 2-thiouridine(34) synthase MnmA [Bacteroidales bacterium]|nr:tRNA 2-thiouridine(34) synthase MnmA [Bacteroidales bacterium]
MLNKRKNIKVAVGISGGVDSSVAAALLLKQGYEVFGIFIQFWAETIDGKVRDNICCSLEAQQDARRVCQKLSIPFYTMNLRAPFKENVVDYFIEEYGQGRTPNPCVMCNKQIKFGDFWQKAKALGADYIATGHYAVIEAPKNKLQKTKNNQKKRAKLIVSKDMDKDQTYFLHQLNQEKLSHVLFPIGKYKKPEVRKLAAKFDLPTAAKRESQEICFIPNGSLSDFLKKYLPLHKGEIRDYSTKEIIGEHNGLALYTIGQRKGIGLGGGPWFVVQLDIKKNILWVSKNVDDLGKKELILKKVNWISGVEPTLPMNVKCKVRYASDFVSGKIIKENNKYKVIFKNSVRAVTAGQFCVMWKGKECLGGGEIS